MVAGWKRMQQDSQILRRNHQNGGKKKTAVSKQTTFSQPSQVAASTAVSHEASSL